MKKITLMMIAFVAIAIQAAAQGGRPIPADLKVLLEEQDTTALNRKLDSLSKSSQEEALILLSNYYAYKDQEQKSVELIEQITTKFPYGITAFNRDADALYNESDSDEKILKYNAFMKKYAKRSEFEGNPFFQSANTFVAFSLVKNHPEQVKPWLEKITDSLYKTKAYSYAARELHAAGQFAEAEKLIMHSIDQTRSRQPIDSAELFESVRMAAYILLDNKNFEKAQHFAKMAYDEVHKPTSRIHKSWTDKVDNTYFNSLVGIAAYAKVYPMMVKSIENGSATPLIKEHFRAAYLSQGNAAAAYQPFLDSLEQTLLTSLKVKAQKEMQQQVAFNFNLRTPEGKEVSLESLKGKVVVLDFWATWCGPCKASFPRMQLAVNKYKQDKDVIFLFVHTWERTNDQVAAIRDAQNYLNENGYDFNLLMDLKSSNGERVVNKAAAGFGLKGIPTKLIIDKQGLIRFNVVGDSKGGDDEFLKNMQAMIDLAKENS